MLESGKHHVLEVDTLGQQVSPRVRYGMACLLIRDVVGSVPCLYEWKIGIVSHLGSHDARGAMVPRTTLGNLSIAMIPGTTLAKSVIRPIVNLCNGM
jgi:hypothetical protein